MIIKKKFLGHIVCLLFAFIVLFFWQPASVSGSRLGPSFDCNKASTKVEKAICDSKKLSVLDRELSEIYRKKRAIPDILDDVRKSQLEWLRNERSKCERIGDDESSRNAVSRVDCLKSAYYNRIENLNNLEENTAENAESSRWKIKRGTSYSLCNDTAAHLNSLPYPKIPRKGFDLTDASSRFRHIEMTPVEDPESYLYLIIDKYKKTILNINGQEKFQKVKNTM